MAPLKIASFVDESEVPLLRRGGIPNPELAELVQTLIERAEKGNRQFAFVPIEDKLERKRTGESVRGQVRARGYSLMKQTGMGKVERKFKSGKVKVEEVMGLYLRAEPFERPTNGTVRKKKVRTAAE